MCYVQTGTVFIVNFGLCLCALIHSLICIRSTQNKIEIEQLQVGLMEEKEDSEQFPICLERLRINNSVAASDPEISADEIKWYTLPKLSGYEWFMILNILYINTTPIIAEICWVVYFAIHVVEDLDGNIIVGTSQLMVVAITFISGNLLINKWCSSNLVSNESIFKNKYLIMSIALISLISLGMVFFPFIPSINMYWLFNFISGLSLGILSMTSELILLEIQPTKESGKISGAKGLLRNWLKAIALLLVSIFWEYSHNSFFYVAGCSCIMGLLCTSGMIIAKKWKSQQISAHSVKARDENQDKPDE